MPTITNKTNRPLSVPLPRGRRLFLGPGKTGQVVPKALDHPPLKKLVDEGALELSLSDQRRMGGGGGKSLGPQTGHQGTGGVRHTGDR